MKPMLAATLTNMQALKFPTLASEKLDGIRCIVKEGVALSRSLKPIPNAYVQHLFGRQELDGLDGELIVGATTSKTCYRDTNSGVMSTNGEPDVVFHAFDCWSDPDLPFKDRLALAGDLVEARERLTLVRHIRAESVEDVLTFEEARLSEGHEGVMLRNPWGGYKHGRATEKSQDLLKLKRFTDAEAVIVGMEELMHNGNEAMTDHLGHTKRSSHQANKSGKGTMGALVVRDTATGVEFNIGTGFTEKERLTFWLNETFYVGKVVKYKHFAVGAKDLPRFPTFLGMRDIMDMIN